MNADGSIKYSALASSGYGDWLATRAEQQPGLFGDIFDGITKAATDVGAWVLDNVALPVAGAVEDGFGYVGAAWDAFVDWVANATDDIWETIQEGIGSIAGAIYGRINVTINVNITNRDPQLGGGRLVQAWGTPLPNGQQPFVVPQGVMVRIRQWGFGFLPALSEEKLGPSGTVVIEAIEEGEGQEEDELCIELESDDGMITTDLAPNEVCNFYGPNFDDFEHDTNNDLWTNQADLHAFAQITDSAAYTRKVIGHEPGAVHVLTGFIANNVTKRINGGDPRVLVGTNTGERAMALCLDFPSVSSSTIGALVGPLFSPLIQKDIWWPDVGGAPDSRTMTHEYGHYLMCDMLYYESGPSALTALMERVLEGQNDQRDDVVTLATEAIADTFTMQVVGGANYIVGDNATRGRIKYCLVPSCMDFNYKANFDYPEGIPVLPDDPWPEDYGFYDELAQVESIIHDAFDRSDSAWRKTDQPWNGDVWEAKGSPQVLTVAPMGYLAFADESVSLSGGAWRNWMAKWAASGPDVSPTGILAALNDTMKDESHNFSWCQRCEVFALHDPSTPGVDGDAEVDGRATPYDRWRRWKTCADGDVDYFSDAPPEPNVTLNASCQACPGLHFADYATQNGTCTQCPAGWIGMGDHCQQCPAGTVPTTDNQCTSCPAYEIAVNGSCVPCRFGEGADRSTNTCRECPADVAVDFASVAIPRCDYVSIELAVPTVEDPSDICPGNVWVEARQIGRLIEEDRDLTVYPVLEEVLSGAVTESECPTLATVMSSYREFGPESPRLFDVLEATGSNGSWERCNLATDGDCGFDEMTCDWDTELTFTPASLSQFANRIRFQASGSKGFTPQPVRLTFSLAGKTGFGCGPN